MKTQFTQGQINEVMERRACTRKAALRWLNRNAKDTKKGKAAAARDFKSAAAHDIETPTVKLPAKNASLVAKGGGLSRSRWLSEQRCGHLVLRQIWLSAVLGQQRRTAECHAAGDDSFRSNPKQLADKRASLSEAK